MKSDEVLDGVLVLTLNLTPPLTANESFILMGVKKYGYLHDFFFLVWSTNFYVISLEIYGFHM